MKRLVLLATMLVFAVPASASTARIVASQDWWPVPSPDGTYVAYTRVYANHMELDVLDVASRQTTVIGSNGGQLAPSWSSDSSRLAYSSGGILYTVAPDGSGRTRYLAPQKAFAPAFRPGTAQLAYLTTHGAQNTDLWFAGRLWAIDAIGQPAWSPDGSELAFQRDDGIYAAAQPRTVRRVVSAFEPGPPSWSRDGTKIAFVSRGALYVVPAAGGTPVRVGPAKTLVQHPSWSATGSAVRTDGAYLPDDRFVAPMPRPGCPGHQVLGVNGRAQTGSCTIAGTAKADTIEGTPLWGDVIVAGAGNDRIHANDGHTDRVDCGPGRDTVWADRTDRLVHCEVVHR